MKLLYVTLALWEGCYLGLLLLFARAVSGLSPDHVLLWAAWLVSGGLLLRSTALDLTFFLVWVGLRAIRRAGELSGHSARPNVPWVLSAAERDFIEGKTSGHPPPTLGVVMPAHAEASTPRDRQALADRIYNLTLYTPASARVVILFDSPEEYGEIERGVIADVSSRLAREGGTGASDPGRLSFREYRKKEPALRNKPGSLRLFLEREGAAAFQYIFLVDADSTLPQPNPARPETCDGVSRMLLAMERDPRLAMLQAAIQIPTVSTLWGWAQRCNARLAWHYHIPLFEAIYHTSAPCYGHNCLLRTRPFYDYCVNTLEYLSHDHVDSSDLMAAGWKCQWASTVVTYEEAEESLLGYEKRQFRWARGNAQFLAYLLSKEGLTQGARMYLGLGIMHFLWPLLSSVFLLASVGLSWHGALLIAGTGSGPRCGLLLLVLLGLLLPKIAGSLGILIAEGPGRAAEGLLGSLSTGLIAPALAPYDGAFFLVGPCQRTWPLPRATRSTGCDGQHITSLIHLFSWSAFLGLFGWLLLDGVLSWNFGHLLLRASLLSFIAAPVAAIAFSCPWGDLARRLRGN